MKPPFTQAPQRWLNSSRVSQTPSEYANAFEHYKKPASRETTILVATAVALLVGAATLVIFTTPTI